MYCISSIWFVCCVKKHIVIAFLYLITFPSDILVKTYDESNYILTKSNSLISNSILTEEHCPKKKPLNFYLITYYAIENNKTKDLD